MILFFKEERDREFIDLCVEIQKSETLPVSEIVKRAINSPASSFFLTYKGYERIINHKGQVRGCKSELYREIKERVKLLDCKNTKEACIRIDEQPAPKFYISHARAVSLYYELIKKYNNEISHRISFYNRVFGV